MIHQPAQKSARSDALSRNHDWKPEETPKQNTTLIKPDWDKSPHIRQMTADPLIEDIIKETDYDPEVVEALKTIRTTDPKQLRDAIAEWTVHEGLIIYQGRIYVPQNKDIKLKLLKRHHDSPGAGHPGREKTLELLSRNYWWPSMTHYIGKYISSCDTCQHCRWEIDTKGPITLHLTKG